MFHHRRQRQKLNCLIGLLVCILLVCVTNVLSAEAGETQNNSQPSSVQKSITGKIHFYQGRYLLKQRGEQSQKFFTLLETPVLEEILQDFQHTSLYTIEGKAFSFQENWYLLPQSFSLLSQKTEAEKKNKIPTITPPKTPQVSKTPEQPNKKQSVPVAPKPQQQEKPKKKAPQSKPSPIKLTTAAIKKAIYTGKGVPEGFRIIGDLDYQTLAVADYQRYKINLMGELIKGNQTIAIAIKIKNSKQKLYSSEAEVFVAALNKLQQEKGYQQIEAIYISRSGFSGPAEEYLQEHGVNSVVPEDFLMGR